MVETPFRSNMLSRVVVLHIVRKSLQVSPRWYRKKAVAGCRPLLLIHYFIQSSFSFTLGFHIVVIQRALWTQSLWKTNDLRVSCSQNAYRFYLDVSSGWSPVRWLGKGIPWQNFIHLCEELWFLSNPKEDAMRNSLCVGIYPHWVRNLLFHSVGCCRVEVEKKGPVILMESQPAHELHLRLWSMVQCCSRRYSFSLDSVDN